MFGFTFNNMSVISWSSVDWWLKVENPEKTTDLSQVTDTLYHTVLHRVLLDMKGVLTLVVIGTDCTCRYKSNYNANMTMTVLLTRNLKSDYITTFTCLACFGVFVVALILFEVLCNSQRRYMIYYYY
jgi:hypothetical protein